MNSVSKAGTVAAAALLWAGLLAAQTPPAGGRGAGAAQGAPAPPARGRGTPAPTSGGAGPDDKPIVDPRLADQARPIWAAECINCHGSQARGTDNGPNLIRSLVVLHDRYGSELGPFLKKGHKLQSGRTGDALTNEEIVALAHFLRQRVTDTLRGAPDFDVKNILTGDPKAGEAFFNGAGRCTACHSATGNLAGIGTRYTPVNIQQRFLFPPRAGRGRGAGAAAANPVSVTVTPPGGTAVSGTVVQMDDFVISLRDSAGVTHTFARTPSLRVVKTDPLAAHIALLDTITDKQIHDVVAYLETLK